jgi:hypothetical protein
MIIYCFTFRSRIFHLYGDVTIITGEGLQNLGLCSALRAFEQGRIFIVPHLLWHGASVFPVSSEGPPHSVASYDTQRDVKDLFWPGSSRAPYQSPFTTHKGMWGTYSIPDPHRTCLTYDQFLIRGSLLTNKWITQGFLQSRLQAAFCKFYGRYSDLVEQYNLAFFGPHVIWYVSY